MKHISILISIILLMLLVSCGGEVTSSVTQSGSDESEQEQTANEGETQGEELIEELLEEVEETEVEESEAMDTEEVVDVEEEEEIPAIDLSTALVTGNGTEPFWGFSASGSTLILREPSDTGPMSMTTYSSMIMTNVITGISIAAPGMSLDLVLGTCSDGMSDIVYAYSTTFVAGTTNYTGCANVN